TSFQKRIFFDASKGGNPEMLLVARFLNIKEFFPASSQYPDGAIGWNGCTRTHKRLGFSKMLAIAQVFAVKLPLNAAIIVKNRFCRLNIYLTISRIELVGCCRIFFAKLIEEIGLALYGRGHCNPTGEEHDPLRCEFAHHDHLASGMPWRAIRAQKRKAPALDGRPSILGSFRYSSVLDTTITTGQFQRRCRGGLPSP